MVAPALLVLSVVKVDTSGAGYVGTDALEVTLVPDVLIAMLETLSEAG